MPWVSTPRRSARTRESATSPALYLSTPYFSSTEMTKAWAVSGDTKVMELEAVIVGENRSCGRRPRAHSGTGTNWQVSLKSMQALYRKVRSAQVHSTPLVDHGRSLISGNSNYERVEAAQFGRESDFSREGINPPNASKSVEYIGSASIEPTNSVLLYGVPGSEMCSQ